jgi:hypothetical protein
MIICLKLNLLSTKFGTRNDANRDVVVMLFTAVFAKKMNSKNKII